MTIEVTGHVRGSSLVYACPFCHREHTHGYAPGGTLHRVSHCTVNPSPVLIKI
jgi:hypothetical protein